MVLSTLLNNVEQNLFEPFFGNYHLLIAVSKTQSRFATTNMARF